MSTFSESRLQVILLRHLVQIVIASPIEMHLRLLASRNGASITMAEICAALNVLKGDYLLDEISRGLGKYTIVFYKPTDAGKKLVRRSKGNLDKMEEILPEYKFVPAS